MLIDVISSHLCYTLLPHIAIPLAACGQTSSVIGRYVVSEVVEHSAAARSGLLSKVCALLLHFINNLNPYPRCACVNMGSRAVKSPRKCPGDMQRLPMLFRATSCLLWTVC